MTIGTVPIESLTWKVLARGVLPESKRLAQAEAKYRASRYGVVTQTLGESGPPKAIIAMSFFAVEIGSIPFRLSRKILARLALHRLALFIETQRGYIVFAFADGCLFQVAVFIIAVAVLEFGLAVDDLTADAQAILLVETALVISVAVAHIVLRYFTDQFQREVDAAVTGVVADLIGFGVHGLHFEMDTENGEQLFKIQVLVFPDDIVFGKRKH